jgi:hypothetical protein
MHKVSHGTYPGCDVTYNVNTDIKIKLSKLRRIYYIKRTLSHKTRKEVKIKSYNEMVVPTLL